VIAGMGDFMNVLKCEKCKKISYSSRSENVKCPYCGNFILNETLEENLGDKNDNSYIIFKMKFNITAPST